MIQNSIGRIHRKSLSEIAVERIADAIVEGRLLPGARINEVELAAQLGISRSPVREALFLLEPRGLVVRRHKGGTYVWEPTEEDVDEIFSLRVVVESLAAEWAASRLTSDALKDLEAMIARQRAIEQDERYFLSVTRENRLFHEHICLLSNHARLIRLWNQLADQYEVLAYRRMRYDCREVQVKMIPAHEDLLEALRKKDLTLVQRLHAGYNHQVAREIKEVLRATSTAPSAE